MPTHRDQFIRLLSELKSKPAREREPAIQAFIEARPSLITEAHYVHSKVVLSKLPVGNWVTDFAYIHPQSGEHVLYLIEIEDPQKKIFTSANNFTESFNKALQQVHDWMSWAAKNRDYFLQLYGDLEHQFGGNEQSMLFARGVLVYGRREQVEQNVIRRERWSQKKANELSTRVEVMTYDGLIERNLPAFAASHRTEFDCTAYAYGARAFHRKV